jgi:hypothetical protein
MEPKLCKPLNYRYQWDTPVTTNTEINTTGCVYRDVMGKLEINSCVFKVENYK